MPKAVLEFQLPEEREEFELAMNGAALAAFHDDVGNHVFRPARKHGYSDQEIQRLIESLDELVEKHAGEDWPSHEYGRMDATHLVSLLEQLYYRLRRDDDF